MFEVGFTEIILILGIALVVLGPEKLPRVAADIGRWLGRARALARQLRVQLDEETLKGEQPWMQQRRTWQPPPAEPAPADPPPATGPASEGAAPHGSAAAAGDPAGAAPPPDEPGTTPPS